MRKILVIGTGGTISCAESQNGLTPAVPVAKLLDSSYLKSSVELSTEQLFNLDSTNMTPRHWEMLARRIRERYDEFGGFVVTHGTDTMGYAAASLSCLIQNSRKPIAFTGSMLPMSAENSDAPQNLRDAAAYAADERACGVKIVFSGKIYDGRSVSKMDSDALSPFPFCETDSGSSEDLAVWQARENIETYSGETRFYDRLSDDVFLARLIPGQELIIPEKARAVILDGYGSGGIPGYITETVGQLADKGVYLIIATQCAFGGTDLLRYEVGRTAAERFSLLETGKMTIEYAVARARWALEYSNGFDEFRELFCGPDLSR